MVAFLIILITLYLLYKATPWLLAWWVRRQRRKFEERMGEAYDHAARQQQAQQRAQERASHIDDNAEDADYVELQGPRETVAEETFTVEEQVIDAEFEEI